MVFIHLLISPSGLARLGNFHTLNRLPSLLRFLAPFLSCKLPSATLPPYPHLQLSLSLHRNVTVKAL